VNLTAKSNSLFKCIITNVSLRFPGCKDGGKSATLRCTKHKITELFQTLGMCNTHCQRKTFSSQNKRNTDFETLYLVSKNWWKAEGLPAGISFCCPRHVTKNLSRLYNILSAGGTWWEHQPYLQIYLVPTAITQFILSCISHSLL